MTKIVEPLRLMEALMRIDNGAPGGIRIQPNEDTEFVSEGELGEEFHVTIHWTPPKRVRRFEVTLMVEYTETEKLSNDTPNEWAWGDAINEYLGTSETEGSNVDVYIDSSRELEDG